MPDISKKTELPQCVQTSVSKRFMMTNDITYKIDNHSDIISLDLLEDCYVYSINTHWRYREQEYVLKPGLIGCYFLYDENKNVIYIGKTSVCIRGRVLSHCITELSRYLNDEEKAKILLKREMTRYFSFIEVDKQMVDFVERGLINQHQPILNVQFVNVC